MSNNTLAIPTLGNRFFDYRQDCWGDSFNWDFDRNLDQVVKLAIHHSVTAQVKNWKSEVDYIGELHKSRGWSGIGYHFIIGSDGVVAYVGDIGQGRANIAGNNEKIIGICLVGDFTRQLPTDIQINSAHDLCEFFINDFPALKNINSWGDVMGHKDAAGVFQWPGAEPTACPGTSWPNDMKERIQNNIVYTPQAPPLPPVEPIPEPPAPIPPLPPIEPAPTPPPPPGPTPLDQLTSVLINIRNIIYGSGWPWTKISKIKQILPKSN